MHVWSGLVGGRDYSIEFMFELLRGKGRGTALRTKCPGCLKDTEPTYRCRKCSPTRLVCKRCCVREHATMPLHHVEVSVSSLFVKCTNAYLPLAVGW